MSRRRKNEDEEHENHERWLLSYADFITLLMIFFIIMYSISQMDKTKYEQLASVLSVEMGSGGSGFLSGGKEPISKDNMTEEEKKEEKDQMAIKKEVDEYIKNSDLKGSVTTSIEERGLILSFNDALFFDSGKAEVKEKQEKKFIDIGRILNRESLKSSFIRVEGYTDNVPIKNPAYKSNWDLSVLRASNVAQIIIDQAQINPERVSVVGYGEYRPKGDNHTEKGRLDNRRVDILVLNKELNEIESR